MLKDERDHRPVILAVAPVIWQLGRVSQGPVTPTGLPVVGATRLFAHRRSRSSPVALLCLAGRHLRPFGAGRPALNEGRRAQPGSAGTVAGAGVRGEPGAGSLGPGIVGAVTPPARPRTAELLDLAPHPEGGWYRETWRAAPSWQPAGYPGPRAAATGIYFLLDPGEESAWHRVRSDEVWLWHSGGPLLCSTAATATCRPTRRAR